MTRKLKELRKEARSRMHAPVAAQHRWLCRVLRGHYGYYGLPSNFRSMQGFYHEVKRLWFRSLHRRSQRAHDVAAQIHVVAGAPERPDDSQRRTLLAVTYQDAGHRSVAGGMETR